MFGESTIATISGGTFIDYSSHVHYLHDVPGATIGTNNTEMRDRN